MNKNTEIHFSSIPAIDISRSKVDKAHTLLSTWSNGDLIPIFVDEILPGTTIKMKMSEVIRMTTPIVPVMDNCYQDVMFYFVPYRLLWTHWKQFMGENDTAPWTQTTQYQIPQIEAPTGGWNVGSLADYLGYPTGVEIKKSALPFRAYCMIYNEWWRDENLQNPVYITMGDSDTTGKNYNSLTYDPVTDTECGAKPLKACKFHDYFTSALPQSQKGAQVQIPLGDVAPIIGTKDVYSTAIPQVQANMVDKKLYFLNPTTAGQENNIAAFDENGANQLGDGKVIGLAADLSSALGATVTQLRQSFAIQKFLERDARGGTRYIESIFSHFRVTNPDFRMQRPEYLGGKRIPINMNQAIQTDATSWNLMPEWNEDESRYDWSTVNNTPQGNAAAYSVTSDSDEDLFTFSATEHGILMGLSVCRCDHTYQQGVPRMYSRKNKFDFYFPEFANISEQFIRNDEIYAQGTSKDEEAFGYQEAWAEYRFMPSRVTGIMRSSASQSLDIYHYADNYSALPQLGDEWIREPEENMARTLAVQDEPQFWGDFYFKPVYTLPMPLYSVPGLIDHH